MAPLAARVEQVAELQQALREQVTPAPRPGLLLACQLSFVFRGRELFNSMFSHTVNSFGSTILLVLFLPLKRVAVTETFITQILSENKTFRYYSRVIHLSCTYAVVQCG